MPYINVDIDDLDLDIDDLCTELLRQLKSSYKPQRLSPSNKIKLKNSIEELHRYLSGTSDLIPVKSLDDKMKMEFLSTIWNKFNYSELERKLSA